MSHSECENLFRASKAVFYRSGLIHYCGQYFVPSYDEAGFDAYWKRTFDPKFGRYMAWVLFSVGAENLAKAACVCNGLTEESDNTTLDRFLKPKDKVYLGKLNVCGDDQKLLISGYKSLKKVRDRELHSYRENKRSEKYPSIKEHYLPAFNILLGAMERTGHFSKVA